METNSDADSPKDVPTVTGLLTKNTSKLRCLFCHEIHYSSDCSEAKKKSLTELNKSPKLSKGEPSKAPQTKVLCNILNNATYYDGFLQTLVLNLKGKDITRPVRAIMDTGLHLSYISSGAAKEMGYEILRTEELIHALFGGLSYEITSHNCYRVCLENPHKSYTCHFEALNQSVICTNVLGIRNDERTARP